MAKNLKDSRETVLNVCVAQFDSPVFNEEAEEYFLVSLPHHEVTDGLQLVTENLTAIHRIVFKQILL